jgi:hypothetical protein
MYGLVVL